MKAGLKSDDISDFKTKGHETIDQVIQSIKALNDSVTTLTDTQNQLNDNLPDNVLNDNLAALQNWYDTTMAAINAQIFRPNEKQTLAVKDWNAYNSQDTALYQDTAASDALYKTISDLSTSTAKSSQLIKDNGNEFTQMVSKTQETKITAQKLLNDTNNLLATGDSSLKESQNYNSNFGKVLANTRSEIANKNKLFDFFAQPLSVKNMIPTTTVNKKEMDWRWPLVLIIGIIIGLLAPMILKSFSSKQQISNEK